MTTNPASVTDLVARSLRPLTQFEQDKATNSSKTRGTSSSPGYPPWTRA
jgi:hypothetical protein